MFKRKLLALGHVEATSLDATDDTTFKNLIVWLEDQKIRHYKVEDRSQLRQIQSPQWQKAYEKYLHDLDCPIKNKRKEEELEWLLTFGVSLEFEDNADKYKTKPEAVDISAPKVTSENPLDKLDFQSAEFVQGVNKLASILQVDTQPNHLLTLEAISKLVTTRLNENAIKDPDSVVTKGTAFPFEEADSGFSLGDPVLNRAAKILRLLYIHDLRNLQTSINECIVGVQNITANPKTDTKLGQVGR